MHLWAQSGCSIVQWFKHYDHAGLLLLLGLIRLAHLSTCWDKTVCPLTRNLGVLTAGQCSIGVIFLSFFPSVLPASLTWCDPAAKNLHDAYIWETHTPFLYSNLVTCVNQTSENPASQALVADPSVGYAAHFMSAPPPSQPLCTQQLPGTRVGVLL